MPDTGKGASDLTLVEKVLVVGVGMMAYPFIKSPSPAALSDSAWKGGPRGWSSDGAGRLSEEAASGRPAAGGSSSSGTPGGARRDSRRSEVLSSLVQSEPPARFTRAPAAALAAAPSPADAPVPAPAAAGAWSSTRPVALPPAAPGGPVPPGGGLRSLRSTYGSIPAASPSLDAAIAAALGGEDDVSDHGDDDGSVSAAGEQAAPRTPPEASAEGAAETPAELLAQRPEPVPGLDAPDEADPVPATVEAPDTDSLATTRVGHPSGHRSAPRAAGASAPYSKASKLQPLPAARPSAAHRRQHGWLSSRLLLALLALLLVVAAAGALARLACYDSHAHVFSRNVGAARWRAASAAMGVRAAAASAVAAGAARKLSQSARQLVEASWRAVEGSRHGAAAAAAAGPEQLAAAGRSCRGWAAQQAAAAAQQLQTIQGRARSLGGSLVHSAAAAGAGARRQAAAAATQPLAWLAHHKRCCTPAALFCCLVEVALCSSWSAADRMERKMLACFSLLVVASPQNASVLTARAPERRHDMKVSRFNSRRHGLPVASEKRTQDRVTRTHFPGAQSRQASNHAVPVAGCEVHDERRLLQGCRSGRHHSMWRRGGPHGCGATCPVGPPCATCCRDRRGSPQGRQVRLAHLMAWCPPPVVP